jgi:hypothetical protein
MHRDGPPATPAVWEAYRASNSPLCWVTTVGDGRGVDLGEIVTALRTDYGEDRELSYPVGSPRVVRPRKPKREADAALDGDAGRNPFVFRVTRLWAKAAREQDWDAIQNKAAEVNRSLPDPMDDAETAGIARSIIRYRKRLNGLGGGREADPTFQAYRGAKARAAVAAKTDETLLREAELVVKSGQKLTQRVLMERTGLSRPTVERHWAQLIGAITHLFR